jgi:uncharacterized membrane protein/membrane-bound inhibitor of C-type lysozyme
VASKRWQRALLLLLHSVLLACSQQQGPSSSAADLPTSGQTLVYECGDYEFVARTGNGQIALYLPDEYRLLSQQKSASGSRYGDSHVNLWTEGNEARLELGASRILSCVLNRARAPWEEARRRGVDFRAVGQEPGWYLELQHNGPMLFVVQQGSPRVLLDTPEPELEGGRELYRAVGENNSMTVEVELRHCTDVMSGEVYDSQVSVHLDNNVYRGCGLALEPW